MVLHHQASKVLAVAHGQENRSVLGSWSTDHCNEKASLQPANASFWDLQRALFHQFLTDGCSKEVDVDEASKALQEAGRESKAVKYILGLVVGDFCGGEFAEKF